MPLSERQLPHGGSFSTSAYHQVSSGAGGGGAASAEAAAEGEAGVAEGAMGKVQLQLAMQQAERHTRGSPHGTYAIRLIERIHPSA